MTPFWAPPQEFIPYRLFWISYLSQELIQAGHFGPSSLPSWKQGINLIKDAVLVSWGRRKFLLPEIGNFRPKNQSNRPCYSFLFVNNLSFLFSAALGLCCRVWALSGCDGGSSLVAVHGFSLWRLLLWTTGVCVGCSSCGMWTQWLRVQALEHTLSSVMHGLNCSVLGKIFPE